MPKINQPVYTVETYNGNVVDLVNPDPGTITLADIAWSLSRLARFNGHTTGLVPYSVAQHSLWVSRRVMETTGNVKAAKFALLHDAHEAYIGDIVSPLKGIERISNIIKDIERCIQFAIHSAMALPAPRRSFVAAIKQADQEALALEAYYLMPSGGEDWNLPDLSDDVMNSFYFPVDCKTSYESFLAEWLTLDKRDKERKQAVAS